MVSPNDDPQRCIFYFLKPDAAAEYDLRHREMPPGVCRALGALGYHDYSIFRRGDLVVSVYRSGNPLRELSQAENDLLADWTAALAPLFDTTTDDAGAPLSAAPVFRLEGEQPAPGVALTRTTPLAPK